jgi:hypothetical protein
LWFVYGFDGDQSVSSKTSNRMWLCVSMRPGKMMPFVCTTEASAASGSPAHEGATQVSVSPSTSTSPSKATSGVTIVPASSTRSRRASRTTAPAVPASGAGVGPASGAAGAPASVAAAAPASAPPHDAPAGHGLAAPCEHGMAAGDHGLPSDARPKHWPAALEAVGPPTSMSSGVPAQALPAPPIRGEASRRHSSGVTELM